MVVSKRKDETKNVLRDSGRKLQVEQDEQY